jgi:hypothetical protein
VCGVHISKAVKLFKLNRLKIQDEEKVDHMCARVVEIIWENENGYSCTGTGYTYILHSCHVMVR